MNEILPFPFIITYLLVWFLVLHLHIPKITILAWLPARVDTRVGQGARPS